MEPITLQSTEESIRQNKAILLYFYSDQCAPCVSLRPKIQDLIVEEFSEMKLLFIDSASHPEITSHFGIFANPTLLVFFEGREFQRWSKYVAVSQIAEALNRPYNMVFES